MKAKKINQVFESYTTKLDLGDKEVLYMSVFDDTLIFNVDTSSKQERETAVIKTVKYLCSSLVDDLMTNGYPVSLSDVLAVFHGSDIDDSEAEPRCLYSELLINVAITLSAEWCTWNLSLDDKLASTHLIVFAWEECEPETYDVYSINMKTLVDERMTVKKRAVNTN